MKKFIVLALILALLALGGCGQSKAAPAAAAAPEPTPTAEPVPEVTPEPTPEPAPKPVETEAAEVVALYGMPVIEKLMRGDEIEVLSDVPGLENYAIVRHGEKLGIMAMQFFSADGESNYATWKGYPTNDAKLYTDYDFNLTTATGLSGAVTVLDAFDICYRVETADGATGYVPNDEITTGHVSGKGSSQSRPQEGQDIVLGYEVNTNTNAFGTKAVVKCDKAPLLAALYDYGDTVQVLATDGSECALLANGLAGEDQKRFFRFEDEAPYESWTGYAVSKAGFWKNVRLIGTPVKTLSANEEVTVLNEFAESYLVNYKGELGYMDKGQVLTAPHYHVSSGGHGEKWTPPIK